MEPWLRWSGASGWWIVSGSVLWWYGPATTGRTAFAPKRISPA